MSANPDNLPDKEYIVPPDPTGGTNKFLSALIAPGDFIKSKVLPKLRGPEYPYYHRVYRRVKTVDECKADDWACIYEADIQYKRDRVVDKYILSVLRDREQECIFHWTPDHEFKCAKETRDRIDGERNWEMKHGDLGVNNTALNAFYKQKHRMVFERRHGPIGYGKKPPSQWKKEWDPSCHSCNFVTPEEELMYKRPAPA